MLIQFLRNLRFRGTLHLNRRVRERVKPLKVRSTLLLYMNYWRITNISQLLMSPWVKVAQTHLLRPSRTTLYPRCLNQLLHQTILLTRLMHLDVKEMKQRMRRWVMHQMTSKTVKALMAKARRKMVLPRAKSRRPKLRSNHLRGSTSSHRHTRSSSRVIAPGSTCTRSTASNEKPSLSSSITEIEARPQLYTKIIETL
jgi:hypothetical protein